MFRKIYIYSHSVSKNSSERTINTIKVLFGNCNDLTSHQKQMILNIRVKKLKMCYGTKIQIKSKLNNFKTAENV